MSIHSWPGKKGGCSGPYERVDIYGSLPTCWGNGGVCAIGNM